MGKVFRVNAVWGALICFTLLALSLSVCQTLASTTGTSHSSKSYAGSESCRKCHEKFYRLWVQSHHGLAMQPFTESFAGSRLTPSANDTIIGTDRYNYEFVSGNGYIVEKGPNGHVSYKIEHVIGGKNVYYFLTLLDRGRLQTLPLAFDVNKKEWFEMASSGVRHFPGYADEPVSWKNWQYTFNTSCCSCHVSQVSTNYDYRTDTYNTVWKEPGINCEACHGGAQEHIRVCEEAPKGCVPKDLKIIRGGRDFSASQNNAVCASCHAKATVITETFQPGDSFFDHFGLVTMENSDYYPDGRDLGENYTFTSWLMSSCVKSGKLDCLHCHTSSGRYKFADDSKANHACMPCHKENVENAEKHTRHNPDSPANKCISCHMPTTEFARMKRSDHSMRPPTPSLSITFKSPNACNMCHVDKSPSWADEWVRKWRRRDYQKAPMAQAKMVDAARKGDWTRFGDMLDYVCGKDRDEIVATSLLRLIRSSGDNRLAPALLTLVKDPSPLVRSAAVTALTDFPTRESVTAIVEAAGDESRLVRVSAAAVLVGLPNVPLTNADRKKIDAANKEYLASIMSRPDRWDSHYNLGNYYLERGQLGDAISAYDKALKFEPKAVLAIVNGAMAYARMGKSHGASELLQKALEISPGNPAANFNMALLKAEQNDLVVAEKHLRAALESDPRMAPAAYNLCIILAKDRLDEALTFCRQAVQYSPTGQRYSLALAFYQQQKGDVASAVNTLEDLLSKCWNCADAHILLGGIYARNNRNADALKTYQKGLQLEGLSTQSKFLLERGLDAVQSSQSEVVTK